MLLLFGYTFLIVHYHFCCCQLFFCCTGKYFFYLCIKALCFHNCLCLLYMVLLLKLDLTNDFRFAVITKCLLLKKKTEFIFTIPVWSTSSWCWSGSFLGHRWFYFFQFCKLLWTGWSSHILCILSIGWVCSGQMAGTIISAALVHGHFCMCLLFFSYCLCPPFTLFCWNLLYPLDWGLSQIRPFGLKLFCPH